MSTQEFDVIAETRNLVRQRMESLGAGHDWAHVQRVVSNALAISRECGGDQAVIELSALLHDIGDAKFHGGQERSGEFSQAILENFGLSSAIIDQVVDIVDNISFRKRETAAPLSLEGEIVQDADRLDALGAIGIVRTIEYGHSIGRPFHSSDGSPATIDHFHEKLLTLSSQMNTEVGRRIAVEREQFMVEFLKRFKSEAVSLNNENQN